MKVLSLKPYICICTYIYRTYSKIMKMHQKSMNGVIFGFWNYHLFFD